MRYDLVEDYVQRHPEPCQDRECLHLACQFLRQLKALLKEVSQTDPVRKTARP